MKKQTLMGCLLAFAVSMSAMGQGYITFAGTKNTVYNGPTGTSGLTGGYAALLWAPVSTADALGAGLSTTAATAPASTWSTISSMLSSGWTLLENNGAEADATINPSGLAVGGIAYNAGSPFQVTGTSAGTTYELVVVAWDGGATTLSAAMTAGDAVGWSTVFDYATGASSSDPNGTKTLNSNGLSAFGVAPLQSTPEPGTMALAGLGSLSLFLFRRKK